MAVEKGLFQAPKGVDEEETEQLEIEIVNPEMVTLDDGSMEITIVPDAEGVSTGAFDENIAENMDEDQLSAVADELLGNIDSDLESRKEWADTFVKGLDVLGFKYEERTEPWEGSCGVYSSVLAEAAIRFQAETMSETFPAQGPVKTKMLGQETKDKKEAADRVKADMNYELTENMIEYRSEHERLLYNLGLAGSGFKKVYYDPNLGRQVAVFVPAEDVIVPYGASHIETAERVTHVMRKTKNELKKLQASGFYVDVDLGEPQAYHSDIEERKAEEGGYSLTNDNRYSIYEVHADIVIDGVDDSDEGLAKPYIVSIERGSYRVLAIRRNWNPDDSLMLKRQHFVHYVYTSGFGFYGLGLIHIIGGYARAGTSIIRQLVDAGTLANLPGGLKARGLRIKGDDTPIEPGSFRDVDVPSGSIRDNIMPLPYKEPSQVLLALLKDITNEGRRLGAISDMNISDMSANAPVGTTLALLERTLKPMAAVQARVHYAMKQEFKLLKRLMAEYAPLEYDYQPERGEVSARQADYAMTDVIPVSDPNSSTMAQRVVQHQAVFQMAQAAPQIYDLPQLHRQMIEVLGVKNAEKIVPIKDDMKPTDPISENMAALQGKPMRAFIYQDQDAHIETHMAFMQDPMIAQMIGQNPQAKQIMASLQAHIAEHLGFKYRKDIEERLGVELPTPNEELPEEVEVNLSRLVAQAGKELTQAHMQQAAQKQAQQKAQDPVVQMQQAEIQIKAQEVQRKAEKDKADVALQQAEQERKAKKDKADAMLEAAKLQKGT
ncbi:MAG: hypothetical protein CBC71_05900 [Rhodobacteraceae bacterium TMED111]|nr:MAG: hypothetical protein CBC71_05900 [Rhodobacteraceae bacterium TMED111]|tara:strand:+ start:3070 stop:5397 length:2328 start_codon:yes stop_codon:yes gene_type:complete